MNLDIVCYGEKGLVHVCRVLYSPYVLLIADKEKRGCEIELQEAKMQEQ